MIKKKQYLKGLLSVSLILGVLLVGILSATRPESASAISIEKRIKIEQVSPLSYCGRDYLSDVNQNQYKEEFLNAFSITFDDEEFEADLTNTTITCEKKIDNPGTYSCTFTVDDGEKTYTVENVAAVISKKEISVTVFLNGKTNLTVEEGENIYVTYDYDGAIEGDYYLENTSYGSVKMLKNNMLETVAFVEYLPTYVVQNYTVAAAKATSKYYSFVYKKSILNIVEKTVPELTLSSDGTVLVSLFGEFSSAGTLSFVNIGTSATSPEYVELKDKSDKLYDGSSIKNDYEAVACYSMSVDVNGASATNVGCTAFVLLDDKSKNRSEYKVIAFYNNGDTEILNARTINQDYLVFTPKDMGKFIVISPVQGTKISTYIIVITIAIAFVLLVVLFVALFRKKY